MTAPVGVPADFDTRGFVGELFRAFNDHDVERIVALHTADAIWEDPTLPSPVTGRDAIAEHLRAVFAAFPDLRTDEDVELFTGDRGRLAAQWRMHATMTGPMEPPGFAPTGKHVSVPGMCIYSFEDGHLARHRLVYDALGMLEQLHIVPMPDSAAARLVIGFQRATTRVSRSLHLPRAA